MIDDAILRASIIDFNATSIGNGSSDVLYHKTFIATAIAIATTIMAIAAPSTVTAATAITTTRLNQKVLHLAGCLYLLIWILLLMV